VFILVSNIIYINQFLFIYFLKKGLINPKNQFVTIMVTIMPWEANLNRALSSPKMLHRTSQREANRSQDKLQFENINLYI
jgi:hypothetical protein